MLAPSQFPFQIVKLVPKPFDGDDWLFEIKHDGFRILAIRDGASTRLYTRNGRDITRGHRHLVEELESLREKRFVLDGELVVLDDDGRSNFSRLMNGRIGTHVYVFDLLLRGRKDLRPLPLEGRKIALKNLLGADAKTFDHVRFCDHIIGHGTAFFETIKEAGLEGMVAKRRLSFYHGCLTDDWRKVKCMRLHHFVVGGWAQDFGSVLIGELIDGELRYFGKVGSGFNNPKLKSLTKKLSPRKASPFRDPIRERDVLFCEPTTRIPVQFVEFTGDGCLRHARLRLFA
jgi:bifunctional non-homologous end joining protein LigD